jgi:hypothetical protein
MTFPLFAINTATPGSVCLNCPESNSSRDFWRCLDVLPCAYEPLNNKTKKTNREIDLFMFKLLESVRKA